MSPPVLSPRTWVGTYGERVYDRVERRRGGVIGVCAVVEVLDTGEEGEGEDDSLDFSRLKPVGRVDEKETFLALY